MPKIKQLSPLEAQKIAAGEVIERPGNAVKELIENALDAGATTITISLENAGSERITITDNGSGMADEDARLCIKQFATSKIECVEQLSSLTTFGFRGEALASIAAVSRLHLITATADVVQGIELEIDQGTIVKESIRPANQGTTISIHDLFFNVPARKKFLKKKETEWRYIQQIVYAYCLSNPFLHIRVEHDERLLIDCPSAPTLAARVAQLWESEQPYISVESCQGDIKLQGLISHPHHYKYDRSNIFIFVNHRWVKNSALSKAVIKGYLNVIPPDRFPCAYIFFDIKPDQVDINIHPRKEEVQFMHPRIVETLLQQAIKQGLEQHTSQHLALPPQASIMEIAPQITQPQPTFFSSYTPRPTLQARVTQAPAFSAVNIPSVFSAVEQTTQQTVTPAHAESYSLIGVFNKTYLLLEHQDGIVMIDQHAAHERILYERFSSKFTSVTSVALLFPHLLTVSEREYTLVMAYQQLFSDNGILLEPFGTNQLVIHAMPVHCSSLDMKEFISTVVGWIVDYEHVETTAFLKLMHERMHAQMACKAAVKAGDDLSQEHINQLIQDLHTTNNRFTCPHGRPTSWKLTTYEIEKQFKRKL